MYGENNQGRPSVRQSVRIKYIVNVNNKIVRVVAHLGNSPKTTVCM